MVPGWRGVTAQLSPLVVALCLVLIAGLWLATLQRISIDRRQAVSAAMNANSNLAIAFQQQVQRMLKSAEQLATFVSQQHKATQGNTRLSEWAAQGFIRETMFNIISVVNEHGDVVDSTQNASGVNYADREFFTVLRDSPHDALFISPQVVGRVSNEVRIPMALRMNREDGRFAGLVVMSVGPDDFTDFYSRADLGGKGMLELIGLDGKVRSRKGGPLSPPETGGGTLIRLEQLQVSAAGAYVHDAASLDGIPRIVSYRGLDDYPLVVAVGTAYDDELAPFYQRRGHYLMQAALATLVILLFTGLLTLLLHRRRQEARALQESEALYRATFNQAGTGIAHVATDGTVLRANRKLHEMLAFEENELSGRNLFELVHPARVGSYGDYHARTLLEQAGVESDEIEKPYRRKDGAVLWVCETVGVVRAPNGGIAYLVVVMQDITARKALEAKLSHDAMHDVLTGLPNRNMFNDRLSVALAAASRRGHLTAVLYLDLDGFKQVNDSHGHAVGDMLLQQVADRLRATVRAEDTVSRFGGDEFAIVLANISSRRACTVVTDKLVCALSEPYPIDGLEIRISASVGAAVYPIDGADERSLILSADAAMYTVKGHKRRPEKARAEPETEAAATTT